MLKAEKENFMNRLNKTRQSRLILETAAATFIQKQFRGHLLRRTLIDVVNRFRILKHCRDTIRNFLLEQNSDMILSLGKQRKEYSQKRYFHALIIQCAFRKYVSRKCIRRKRRDILVQKVLDSIITIQTWIRKTLATIKVKAARDRYISALRQKSALKLQSVYRSNRARRKVKKRRYLMRWVAARMIQNWYRITTSKTIARTLRDSWMMRKRYRGALGVQRITRGFVARRRVLRIKLRRVFLLLFRRVASIQRLIRGFVARKQVMKLRLLKKENPIDKIPDNNKNNTNSKEENKGPQQRESKILDAETLALLKEVDIFEQAKLGNTRAVTDIFKGHITDEKHTVTETDMNGDTVLTIAASKGYLDLLRKCLQWGFNINHRNEDSENALILAVKGGHTEVVSYILNPPSSPDDYEEKPENQVSYR